MKNVKSLTCLFVLILVSACNGHSSAAFSSSINSIPETSSSSSSQTLSQSSSFSSAPSSGSSSQSSSGVDPATAYEGYYSSLVSWTDGEDLKNQLYTIMRNGYQPLSYATPNYETNINADHTKYDFEYLDVLYSSENMYKTDTNKKGWQREHAFCASLMCGSGTTDAVKMKGRATDFHNLFAADGSANGSRGNKNYGMADKTASNYTNRTTDGGYDGYSYSANFEPGDKDKGRLARAIFYMATMYKNDEEDTVNNVTMKGLTIKEQPVDYVAGESGAFAIGNLSTLLNWNSDYDVDYLEMQHNISVYKDIYTDDGCAQGNRNPYVDFPGLVDYAFGSKKDQAGELKDIVPTQSYLKCDEHTLSHYALKQAKRTYELGGQIANEDYVVVAVYKDYSYEVVNSGYTNSLSNHVFSENDGESIKATITAGENSFSYNIVLNPMINCSTGVVTLNTTGINDKTPNVEESVSWGGYDFYFSFTTSNSEVASGGMTLRNDNQNGGFYLGSGNKELTSLTIKTKESYTVDQAYIKACANNATSSFSLTIKVGDQVLLSSASVSYNQQKTKVFGAKANAPLTGQVTYIFTGSNALRINSIAFNAIIA